MFLLRSGVFLVKEFVDTAPEKEARREQGDPPHSPTYHGVSAAKASPRVNGSRGECVCKLKLLNEKACNKRAQEILRVTCRGVKWVRLGLGQVYPQLQIRREEGRRKGEKVDREEREGKERKRKKERNKT